MLVFSILSYRKKILLTVSRRVRCLECFRKARLSSHTKNKETAVKDVTLYYYNRQKFFRLIGLACASQFVFWSWMAYFQFSKLHFVDLLNRESKKTQEKILDVSSKPGVMWKIVRYIEDWCYQFSPSVVFNMVFVLFIQDQPLVLACFAVAVGLFFTTSGWIYSLRSVNRLVLQGNNVRVVTHTPLGGTRSVTVPVSDVSCSGSRIGTKPQVTLKLKGHTFFFLVDKEGEFLQPTLFDRTVGVKRF